MSDNALASSPRLKNVDVVKGFAALAIVILHAIVLQPGGTPDDVTSSPALDFLYSGLFLFFIFSGYFYRPNRSVADNIKRRLYQLVFVSSVCIIALSAIMWVYLILLGYDLGPSDLFDSLWLVIGGKTVFQDLSSAPTSLYTMSLSGYYFIQIMACAFVIFYPLANFAIKSNRNLLVTIAAMLVAGFVLVEIVHIKLPLQFHQAPLAAAFMFVGAFMKKIELLNYIETGWRTKRYWVICAVVTACAFALLVFIPPGHKYDLVYYGAYGGYSMLPFFITMILCGYTLMVLTNILVRIPGVKQVFGTIGKHSLAMLLFHVTFIKLLVIPFYHFDGTSAFPAMPLTSSVPAALIASAAIVILAELYPTIKAKLFKK
ncbi:MAG: acyltransferase [archaeon]|nr:acyltransferase [archaeon]